MLFFHVLNNIDFDTCDLWIIYSGIRRFLIQEGVVTDFQLIFLLQNHNSKMTIDLLPWKLIQLYGWCNFGCLFSPITNVLCIRFRSDHLGGVHALQFLQNIGLCCHGYKQPITRYGTLIVTLISSAILWDAIIYFLFMLCEFAMIWQVVPMVISSLWSDLWHKKLWPQHRVILLVSARGKCF